MAAVHDDAASTYSRRSRSSAGSRRPPSMSSSAKRAGVTRTTLVTPFVRPEDRSIPLDAWRRAYDSRFMMTSLNKMQEHTPEHMEHCARTHAEKEQYFRQHSLPNLTWMDLSELTRQRSLHQKQPAYFADVGGPPRVGVLAKRVRTPLDGVRQQPALSLNSKAGRSFGM
eukprot:CAMPEP_0206497252 /NCGR_PEP_ID=MMETSP0324_2-20121206/50055_1 /ASSEMBLY_ACC=CAM_ASM_000836 /TAXON_ID=2866 /ORGANISM="Crypthecodinium cohnii, Strain Seligo" /LENGTH=168 /DNA_ID=CAMNT_0053982747 /DNA_START=12 /DNA_END=518 /DNA_ORIENTATION=+